MEMPSRVLHPGDRCGRAVCDDHWDESVRASTGCAAGRG